MEKEENRPLYRKIVDEFKRSIREGKLRPGDPIPSQTKLAKQYGTSEMTMRKALAILAGDGSIVRIRKRGSFISESALATAGGPDDALPRNIYFVHRNTRANLLNQHFYYAMLSGCADVCRAKGIDFAIHNLGKGSSLPGDDRSAYILFGAVDGSRAGALSTFERWKREGRHMVTVQHFYPHLDIPHVTGDNAAGGYLATQHLLALGHRRIGIIVTGKSIVELQMEFAMRLQGYRMALADFAVPYDPELVVVRNDWEENELSGREGFARLRELAEPPTAIFAASDFKALGVLQAAREQGIRVPQQLSVIGYDGQPLGAWSDPALTTVDQNTYQFGERAVQLLLAARRGERSQATVSPVLKVRASTGPIGGGNEHGE